MDFELPEIHRQLRERVRQFCVEHVAPSARNWDLLAEFPTELIPTLAQHGLLGINVPVAYGGLGLDALALAIVVESIAQFDGALALTIASHNGLAVQHILAVGSEEQKRKYLSRAASGEWMAAWALTEPDAGSDSAAITTTADLDGQTWLLRGTKTFVSQGSICGFCVVLARSAPEGPMGITAFLVDPVTRGFRVTRKIGKIGCRASDTAEIVLDDCRVPDSCRLGGIGAAFYDTMRILDRSRIAMAAMALGVGRAAMNAAVEYAHRRHTFGRALSQHQAIQLKLADASTALDAVELLIHRAATMTDQGKTCTAEAAMAKLCASETATRVCSDAMQIHGGLGYSTDCDVERYLRDAKVCEIAEGTSEIMRMIIARHCVPRV